MGPAVGRDGFGPLHQHILIIGESHFIHGDPPRFHRFRHLQNEHGGGQPAIFS